MKILFVCTGNTCRSPMAEALFKRECERRALDCECKSAGISAFSGDTASRNAVAAMNEVGIDLTKFRSTAISSALHDDYDIFVPMTMNHANALMKLGVEKNKIYIFDKEVSDPFGGSLEVYRKTRGELEENIMKLADFVEKRLGGSE